VNFVPKNAVPRHDGAVQATSGEFAGWWTWTRDHYEVHNGPFWHREENGKVRGVFRVEQKHINGGGAVHGGCLMTFADYCLFAIANTVLHEGRGVTLSFATEFIDMQQVLTAVARLYGDWLVRILDRLFAFRDVRKSHAHALDDGFSRLYDFSD